MTIASINAWLVCSTVTEIVLIGFGFFEIFFAKVLKNKIYPTFL